MAEVSEVLGAADLPSASTPPTLTAEDPTNETSDLSITTAAPLTPSSTDLTTDTPSSAPAKKTKTVLRKKRRPARVQVDPSTLKSEPPPQTGTIFNIWYNKWSGGDREDSLLSKTKAPNRVSIARDSGYTRADGTSGSYFCMFFSRGICPKGRECEYLHRLPDGKDGWDVWSGNVDCFGRDKHSDYRDDMGGVGSFMRQNRTLYVGRIHPTPSIEEVVSRHFSEFGPIERTRCLPARGVAFVTYRTETLAQFAKEAMAHQSLDNDEVLNVRWATTDPNPASQKREARAIEEQAAEAVMRVLPKGIVEGLTGSGGMDEREAKRRRMADNFGLEGYEAPEKVWLENQRALEREEERRLLEGESADGDGDGVETVRLAENGRKEAPGNAGGIFGASTLAALEGYDGGGRSGTTISGSTKPSGPLVGYGSDDDSD